MPRLKIHGQEVEFALNQESGPIPKDTTTPAYEIPSTNMPKYTGLTPGSIFFLDSNGQIATNPSKLFWDAANERLGIGTNSFSANDTVKVQSKGSLLGLRIVGTDAPTLALEGSSGYGYISAGDNGTTLSLRPGGLLNRFFYFTSSALSSYADLATSPVPTQNAPGFQFVNRYWNGSSSTNFVYSIDPLVNSAAPDGYLRVRINGLNLMAFHSNGSIGIGTTAPDVSAVLQLSSTTRGFTVPSMSTAQRDAISSPLNGLIIYNTTTNKLNIRESATWKEFTTV